jgi:hypothetical protein
VPEINGADTKEKQVRTLHHNKLTDIPAVNQVICQKKRRFNAKTQWREDAKEESIVYSGPHCLQQFPQKKNFKHRGTEEHREQRRNSTQRREAAKEEKIL